MTRLGILGGTFDPPHLAHLIMAEHAREQFGLDAVLWVVAGDPPHKNAQDLSELEHRLAMTKRAVKGNPAFTVSRLDIDRPGPHYTVDTLTLASQTYPGVLLYLLVGSDSLRDLPKWHEPSRLTDHATLCVMRREESLPDLSALRQVVPNLASRLSLIDTPVVAISSTDIRQRARDQRSIRYLLPTSVEKYIHKHSLYHDAQT